MRPRVLVVDDEYEVREVLAESLSYLGCDVDPASSGPAALDLLRTGLKPSLVLLDLRMPGFDGLDFLRERDNDPALRLLPVVVLTGLSDEAPRSAQLTLQKPVSLAQLQDLVGAFCARH